MARELVLALVRQAERAGGALGRASDAEALHRFRVALRRLRSVLRAHRAILGDPVPRRRRRSLRRIADATAATRDAEVQRAWLAREARGLGPEGHAAAAFVAVEVLATAGADDGRAVAGRFRRAARKLRRDLRARPRGAVRSPFAAAVADLLREHARDLERALRRVRRASDIAAAHALRIQVKRVRYLIEPLAACPGARAAAALGALKRLQRGLGELHDAQVLEATLLRARRSARAALAPVSASRLGRGLDEIEETRRLRARERFAAVARSLRRRKAASLLGALEGIARRLVADRVGHRAARRSAPRWRRTSRS